MPDSMLYMAVTSDYEYANIRAKALAYQMTFINSKPVVEELENAAEKMEAVAKGIASGFSKTGNLRDNIHARVVPNTRNQQTIILESLAQNVKATGKGSSYRYYGGHVEYGHRARDGSFVQAKPYMRPAMEMVSQSVNLADAMATAFNGFMSESLLMSNILSFSSGGRYGMFTPMNKTYANQVARLGKQTTGSWSKRGQSSVLSKGYERMRSQYSIPKSGGYKGTNSWFSKSGSFVTSNSKLYSSGVRTANQKDKPSQQKVKFNK